MNKFKLGISIGDINGIGLEVILKTLSDERILELCTPIIYGSTKVISYHKNIAKLNELSIQGTKSADRVKNGTVNAVNCWEENVNISLGKATEDGGKFAKISLERAYEDLKNKVIHGLVTAPINKKAMQMAKFEYPGHTEFLTKQSGVTESLMLMVSDELRIGLVTNHLPIVKVAETITKELVMTKIKIFNKTLKRDFGIERPKIAVLGLNPHAGDEGAIGNEEEQIINPAVVQLKKGGILVFGPYAADGFFGSNTFSKFDGILAMYHDQGLVPFKALSFGNGINYTAGLPIIRTSPDHGTGFDIAGQNQASPDSFRKALFTALDIIKKRRDHDEMTSNPLRKQKVKKPYSEDDDETIVEETQPEV